MKALLAGIVAAVVLCGAALAQVPEQPQNSGAASQARQSPMANPPAAQAGGPLHIAPGSVIPVELTKSIDAKKVKTGDAVEAKVTEDLKAPSGMVVVPKDTKVVGHVTQVQPRSKEQKESQLGIVFDRAVVKNMGDVPLPMSVQAIIAPPSSNTDNSYGGGSPEPSPGPGPGGMPAGNAGGRSPQMSGGMPAQTSTPSSSSGNLPSESSSGNSARPPINGNTQGVVGFSNLKLSPPANNGAGSVVSSDKNNVKLESGTFMLLRVNQ